MNKYDEELLKNSPSMIKGIAVEADKLNGGHYLSLTLDDVRGMTEFRLALGGQISEADKVYRKIAGNIGDQVTVPKGKFPPFYRT